MSKNIGKVWETYYRFYNTKKVYGKLRFTYEIIEKDKSKHLVKSELNTHLPSLIIAKNGDSQKEWIKTIRKSSMNEGRGSRGMHNLKWVSWKTDDTRNDNKYVIEYVKIVLDDEDTGMDLDEWNYKRIKCIEKDRTLEQVNNFNETIDWYLKNNKVFNITKISLFNDPNLIKLNLKIKKGSNLFNTLKKASLDSMQIGNLLNNLKKIYNPKSIRPDQDIILAYKENSFYGLALEVNELKEVQIIKTPLGFEEYIYNKPVKKKYIFKEIVIESSLYEDSLKEGMPLEILIDMVRMFSFSVDFQRDIRKGNYFKVYYEFLLNYKGEKIMPGNIIYANAKLKNNILDMFRFNSQNGKHEYFNSNGESIRKTLMKTPIDGARLSSRFGKRVHPVLGYSKMHKGVDFAAKTGTPIYAAGDGVIERANVFGGYGRYIRIRHNSEYKTAYAHLHKFAKNIKRGKSVKQGQIIGYVGSSGRSTGPHLHYEILLNNKQINPQKLKLPEGRKLSQEEFNEFNLIKEAILSNINSYQD